MSASPQVGAGLHRRADVLGKGLDLLGTQRAPEGRHLRGDAALGDDLQGLGGPQALQALGQQCGAHGAGALGAVAAGAVRGVERGT